MRFVHFIKMGFLTLFVFMATSQWGPLLASPYVVEGFRSAKFGMNKNQVIASIKTDFKVPDAKILRDINLDKGTDVLIVKQSSLSVFANPTTISYVFGHKSKKLMAVTVKITEDSKDNAIQQIFLRTAVEKLVPFFEDNDLSAYRMINNVALQQKNAVILFGLLPKSEQYPQALEISLSNVSVQQGDKKVFVDVKKDSQDPIILRISYVQSFNNSDTFNNSKINKKDF